MQTKFFYIFFKCKPSSSKFRTIRRRNSPCCIRNSDQPGAKRAGLEVRWVGWLGPEGLLQGFVLFLFCWSFFSVSFVCLLLLQFCFQAHERDQRLQDDSRKGKKQINKQIPAVGPAFFAYCKFQNTPNKHMAMGQIKNFSGGQQFFFHFSFYQHLFV